MEDRLVLRELTEADISGAREVMLRSMIEESAGVHEPADHADVDDLGGSYLGSDGAFMLVAEDTTTGDVVATGGVRNGVVLAEQIPPQLALLERRYRDGGTGQVVRVHVLPERRRSGIGRALVEAIIDRVRGEGRYERLALHTHPYSPGALPFWLAMGFEEVLDDMEVSGQIFFELRLTSEQDLEPTGTD